MLDSLRPSTIRRIRLGVLAAAVVLGGLALYWFVFRGPTTDAGKLAAWLSSACEADGGIPNHRVVAPGGDDSMAGGFFASYYGRDFKRTVDTHGVKIENTQCETAGGGVVYMQFEPQRYAARAAKVSRRPLCRLADAVFDDDFLNGPHKQLEEFCARLGGTVVWPD